MTEPVKKPAKPRKPRIRKVPTDQLKSGHKTAAGQRIIDKGVASGVGVTPEMDENMIKAQALWESSPRETSGTIAKKIGVSAQTIDGWRRKYGWKKVASEKLPEVAQKAADAYKQNLASLGPEITMEERNEAASKAIEVTAGEMRAAVIDRHRKEWGGARSLSYEAMKKRDFNLAKLAKISAETLLLVQSGERKAWGLDVKESAGGQEQDEDITVIEREQA